ncbi:hypothetical protein D2T29_16795 [Sinirhodobacter populi]|uniref:CMD domain protein n=1 Tax=Paenirhodobacter populi TaxID=2306993 RepID=A0A443K695_9RHOB|nr:hypothetical protein [Sinirhodobacter populi]RWR28297.1 hypothetical protein D2T29_16795 [Sinirhodobacter populi]
MPNPDQTLIEQLALAAAGPGAVEFLAARPEVLWSAEIAYQALLAPAHPGPVSLAERHAVAAFAAFLQGNLTVQSHYRGLLRLTMSDRLADTAYIEAEARRATPSGDGIAPPRLRPMIRETLGPRLSAALDHAGTLALRPDLASGDGLRAAGWQDGAAAILSRIVALVAFQGVLIGGLRACLDAMSGDVSERVA